MIEATPSQSVPPREHPADATPREAELLEALRECTGVHSLALDEARAVWLVFRELAVQVRLVEDPPRVRVTAPIFSAARLDAALLERLNELNGGDRGIRWMTIGRVVVAVGETAALPLVSAHVAQTLFSFCEVCEPLAKVLQAELGADAFPGARGRPTRLH